MKKLTMFYLENCPHCRRAYSMIEELKSQYQKYSNVNIELVEESKNVQMASAHDYYYVPAFFLDGEKLFEGVPSIDKIEEVLKKATA